MVSSKHKHSAVGCHAFAGGFTMGVREVMNVPAQLEIFDLGKNTVESMGVKFIQEKKWEDWRDHKSVYEDCRVCYGNPRCTGFSCMTAGYDETSHGAFAKQTKDIHDLCEFAVDQNFELIVWESVQQAWTVGRPLLDYLRDTLFAPKGYRIAHLFINAASFGNAQHRKRYFFVAYKDDRNFNIMPPKIPDYHSTVNDIIMTDHFTKREVEGRQDGWACALNIEPDNYLIPTDDTSLIIPHLPEGESMNWLVHNKIDLLKELSFKLWMTAEFRSSSMPFSMHCLRRLQGDNYCPVISSSALRFIHPFQDRCLTVRELAALMGWPLDVTPVGKYPVGQIGKGVCPGVGTWLAEMAAMYLDNEWGSEDFESSYNDKKGQWEGLDYTEHQVKPLEKVFDLTRYCPPKPLTERSIT